MVKRILVVSLLLVAALVAITYMRKGSGPVQTQSQPSAAALPGKIAYARSGAIWMYEGDKQHQLTAGPKDRQDKRDAQPSFSPDGAEIVYVRFDEGYSDIYRMPVSDPAQTKALTDLRPQGVEVGQTRNGDQPGWSDLALWALYPRWSPNGERIAYTSDVRTEYPGLFSMDMDGGSIKKLDFLDHSMQTVEQPSYSPDGTKIAVANYLTNNGKGQIWVLNFESGKWTELTNSNDGAYDPAWSPDGEWIAFTMREGTANNIYVVPTDASKWTEQHPTPIKLTTDGTSRAPAWSPDGQRLAYLTLKNANFDLHTADFATDQSGNPTLKNANQLTENANIDATSGLSWGK